MVCVLAKMSENGAVPKNENRDLEKLLSTQGRGRPGTTRTMIDFESKCIAREEIQKAPPTIQILFKVMKFD
jgi:hypothetical protein